MSAQRIAVMLGCGSTTVHRALRRCGIETRPRPELSVWARERLADPEWCQREFSSRRLDELAAELHVAPSTIFLALKRHGLDTTRLLEATRKRRSASAQTRPAISEATRANLRAGQAARRVREQRERDQRELQRQGERAGVLAELGPGARPPERLQALLALERRTGAGFDSAWTQCLDLALDDAFFARTWREVLGDRKIKHQWERAYYRTGTRLHLHTALLGHRGSKERGG